MTDNFKRRFADYVTAQGHTGRKLEIETYLVPTSQKIPLKTFETHLRQKLISEGHKLPWDNTGARLGYQGKGIPSFLTPEQKKQGHYWEGDRLVPSPPTKIELPEQGQIIKLDTKKWRQEVNFGNTNLVYILKDSSTGEVLKVGKTDNFKRRFADYMTAQGHTGRKLEIETYPVPTSERIPLETFETHLRQKLVSEGHKLRWDNTDSRLGYEGRATPGILSPQEKEAGYHWNGEVLGKE
ncbi:MAG TPA: hypothetical protein DEG17_21045 [Cyanobacteria bacterium UBA11149]|nr:hypothetical protein [Cyanobacteria bacterium UBA11366]HBK64170.1 hypothetical protein [Cyanobacteria bacterium UBA11166]HBS68749.1 hypothetical protein [Cyanobacteria bacterium UBA11153]HBW91277.1 hypothetical protein [Cyanobacteria bacterium UBA11149]HCA95792.1 hypothetical protein [Cyanobacteria bacterium UBA9226]